MNGTFGVATGQQIENELRHDAKAWGEAFALTIPFGIGTLVYQLNPWAGYLSGLILLLMELYLFKGYTLGNWRIWAIPSIYARDLIPEQTFTAPGFPARCKVIEVTVLSDSTFIYYTSEEPGRTVEIPLDFCVILVG